MATIKPTNEIGGGFVGEVSVTGEAAEAGLPFRVFVVGVEGEEGEDMAYGARTEARHGVAAEACSRG